MLKLPGGGELCERLINCGPLSWDHCNWLSAVVAPLPIKHLFIIHCSVTGEANKIKQK